jgi:hypothetical protein
MRVAYSLLALTLLAGCGSGGGTATDSSNTQTNGSTCPPGAFCPTSTEEVRCVFGDATSIVINVGDNSQVAFCEQSGGSIQDQPTTNSNNPTDNSNQHPNDQSGQKNTTNNAAPKAQ